MDSHRICGCRLRACPLSVQNAGKREGKKRGSHRENRGSADVESRLFPSRRVLAIGGAILVAAVSCRFSHQPGVDIRQRSRDLTRYLYTSVFDSLPRNTLLDLGGPGDTVLVRWSLDGRRGSLGREWPPDPLVTLEGPQAGPAFLARLEATYGRDLETVDEAVYRCYQPLCERPHSSEYNRIARFSKYGSHTVTVAWLWTNDTLVGGWLIPSRRTVPSEFETDEPRTTLRLPFDGEWVVLWGGTKPHENYHMAVPPLRFAYDFVVDSGGSLYRVDGRSNADYHCWGRPILAPAAGRVVMALDSFAENVPGRSPAGFRGPGNVVIIDHGGGEFSVLAHLRRGSVRVATGQEIEAGETVGECGNNGESLLPHLHYQLQRDMQPGRPVPARFSQFMAEGVRVARGQPTRGQRVEHAPRP